MEELQDQLPSLMEISGCAPYSKIVIDSSKFTIGRSNNNSFVIPNLQLSRMHCTIVKKEENWFIYDTSSFGTYVNDTKIENGTSKIIKNNDIIRLGQVSDLFTYRFTLNDQLNEPPDKRVKYLDTPIESNHANKLQKQIEELEKELKEKEELNLIMKEKLKETEIKRQIEIKELMEKQEREKEEILNTIKEKETNIRKNLEDKLEKLQIEKEKIESSIKEELLKKEAETAESLKLLSEELIRVKKDLEMVGNKKLVLETELENVKKHDVENKDLLCQAKNDLLLNFSEVLETELQCPICNEMFIETTTLNCKHSFCSHCIKQWKKKQNQCPVCRAKITSLNQTLAVDNFINKIVISLPLEMKTKREEMVQERKPKATKSKGKQKRKKTSKASTPAVPVLYVDLIDNEDNESMMSSEGYGDLGDFDEIELIASEFENREYVPGIMGAYYGGYGFCYKCGAEGHWANGCPAIIPGRTRQSSAGPSTSN